LLAESIEFTTCEGAHISKMLTIHDYKRPSEGSCNIAVCRMSTLLLILSRFFDDNGGAGSTHTILSSCNCVLLKDYWIWWLVLVTGDSVDGKGKGKSPSLEAAGFRQQDTQMDSLPFSICLRSFIPD